MRYYVSYKVLLVRQHGTIYDSRTCRANQCGTAVGQGGCSLGTGSGDSLRSVWDFTSTGLSLHRGSAPEQPGAFGARTQSRLHGKAAGGPHRAATQLSPSPGAITERFCGRSALTLVTKEKGAWAEVRKISPRSRSGGLRTAWASINLLKPMNCWFPQSN
jgi:hypothetical protein